MLFLERSGNSLAGLIGDEDTVTGMLLAGIGHVDGQGKKNFLVVDSKVHIKDIEEHFHELSARKDISMILITQERKIWGEGRWSDRLGTCGRYNKSHLEAQGNKVRSFLILSIDEEMNIQYIIEFI